MPRDFVWHGKERKSDLERALKTAIDDCTMAMAEKAEARVRRHYRSFGPIASTQCRLRPPGKA